MTRLAMTCTLAGLLLTMSACSADEPAVPDADADDHGAIEGAEEVAEPPLHLMSIDEAGAVGLMDLVDGTATDVGTISAPSAVATDGRYVFATTAEGLQVVDSGMWTWDHGDHFHYYRSAPDVLGTVPGSGSPTIAPGATATTGGTGVFFPGSGEAVLLDNEALHDGETVELFRIALGAHDGLVAPLGRDGAVVTVPDGSGRATGVRRVDTEGEPVEGSDETCRGARGTITTAVGVVVGCADGALLFVEDDDEWVAERIRYPRGARAPRAVDFAAREGRPTVAALAGSTGFWLLDTRERTWDLVETDRDLVQVVASDDDGGRVLALDGSGRVRVYLAETGEQVAATAPLVAPGEVGAGRARLVVDDQRAYLNDPDGGRVHEIDYADGARIARELAPATGARFVAEVGR